MSLNILVLKDISQWDTFLPRVVREEKVEKSRKGQRAFRAEEKRLYRHMKGTRLLARMAPELEQAKKKRTSSSWSGSIDLSPRGGIYFMGLAKNSRQLDTVRFISRGPGWKVFHEYNRPVRRLLGNRNGSEKAIYGERDAEKYSNIRLPRTELKQIAYRESLEELAAAEELEMLRRQEEVRQQLAVDEEFAREENWWRDWLTESERRERFREMPLDDSPWSEEQQAPCCEN